MEYFYYFILHPMTIHSLYFCVNRGKTRWKNGGEKKGKKDIKQKKVYISWEDSESTGGELSFKIFSVTNFNPLLNDI